MARDAQFFYVNEDVVYDDMFTECFNNLPLDKHVWVFIEARFACGLINSYGLNDKPDKNIVFICSNASEDDAEYDMKPLIQHGLSHSGDLAMTVADKMMVKGLADNGSSIRIKYATPQNAFMPLFTVENFDDFEQIKREVEPRNHRLSALITYSVNYENDYGDMDYEGFTVARWILDHPDMHLWGFTGNHNTQYYDIGVEPTEVTTATEYLDNLCAFLETGSPTNELLYTISTHGS
jgi:hypothetical protein